MLNGALLQEFMATFYGYGNAAGRTWLIGMEEGGGNSEAEIHARLAAWVAAGKPELADVGDFHRHTRLPELYKWFEPSPPIQSTWGKLIKILLASQGKALSPAAVKAFQSNTLGRTTSDTCILELLPLPSPGKKDWFYDQWSTLPELASRRTYEAKWAQPRALHIHQRIQDRQPRLVLFYGGGDRRIWQGVIGEELRATTLPTLYLARCGETLCAFTGLPQAMADQDLQAVGKVLAQHCPHP